MISRDVTLNMLRRDGWKIEESTDPMFELPGHLRERYPSLPSDLCDFLAGLESCRDSTETRWFLCKPDFYGNSGSAFRWNEFELQSLEAAGRDAQERSRIDIFWMTHFPFFLSVAGEYAFFACRLEPEEYGEIVHGREPEYEEATVVAPSFESFLQGLLESRWF